MDNNVIVTIRCLVYNHEPYLKQCLEGFVMQKTNFRFEAIVHDDASTDGSAAIIKEYAEKYPSIIKPIFENENQYSKHDGSIRRIMNEHTHGKYVAMCEGDDYWIDPLKLQKQVDFLEEHPEFSMCFTDFIFYIQKTSKKYIKPYTRKHIIDLDLLLKHNVVPTLTVLYRYEFAKDYYTKIGSQAHSWPMGDYPLWMWIASKKPIYRISDNTAVYRVIQNSASHSVDENKSFFFGLAGFEIAIFFCRYFKRKQFPVVLKREYYILKFVVRRFKRQIDKIKYLFRYEYLR